MSRIREVLVMAIAGASGKIGSDYCVITCLVESAGKMMNCILVADNLEYRELVALEEAKNVKQ